MSDRFKFRCWDNINEEWMDCIHLDIDTGYITGFYNPEQAQKRRYTLMQCTGLKDKNGRLIYEGDVVKDISLNMMFEVGYKKCAFYLENEEHIGYFHELAAAYSERLEVISNIYENKDLLNE